MLTGIADISPYQTLPVATAVESLLGDDEPQTAAVAALELGLTTWFEKARSERHADERARGAAARRAIDAFAVMTAAPLTTLTRSLWHQYARWYAWADAITTGERGDVREAFLRALALTQGQLAADDHVRHIPLWLTICARAGRSYPESYVDLGLLGLRSMPLPPQRSGILSNESLCMSGLVNWLGNRPAPAPQFDRRWLDLKLNLFPHVATYWRDLFLQIVVPARERLSEEMFRAWAKDVGAEVPASSKAQLHHAATQKEEAEALIMSLRSLPGAKAIQRARELVDRREKEAQDDGVTEYLQKTACNIGQALLRRAAGPVGPRATTALEFAMTSLRWAPQAHHGWSLWRDALTALGRYEDAELVSWEAISRFPEEPVLACNLCQLWLADGRIGHARALLEETLEKTNYIVARTMLAGFLLKSRSQSDHNRAEQLLRGGVLRRNSFSANMLAGLLLRRGYNEHVAEAEEVLRNAVKGGYSDSRTRVILTSILIKRGTEDDLAEAEAHLREAAAEYARAATMLADLLFRRNAEGDALEARDWLRRHKDHDAMAAAMLAASLSHSEEAKDIAEREAIIAAAEPEEDAEQFLFEDWAAFDAPSDERPATKPAAVPDRPEELEESEESDEPEEPEAPEAPEAPETPEKRAPGGRREARQLRSDLESVLSEMFGRSGLGGAGEGPPPLTKPKRSSEAVKPKQTATAKAQAPDSDAIQTVRPLGRAAEAAFLMRNGLAAEKAKGKQVLTELAEENDLPFARFLLLGQQPGQEIRASDLESGIFGLALLAAFRTQSRPHLHALRLRFPQEALLCNLAEASFGQEDKIAHSDAAPTLVWLRDHGLAPGPATRAYLGLTTRTGAHLRIANDNEPRFIAALGSTFDAPLRALPIVPIKVDRQRMVAGKQAALAISAKKAPDRRRRAAARSE